MDLKTILSLVCAFLSFLALIIGIITGSKVDLKDFTSIKEFILSILPKVINAVEDLETGEKKKETAITCVLSYVQDKYGSLSQSDLKKLVSYTGVKIEEILSTPTKKETD